jgi:hypothetical protein
MTHAEFRAHYLNSNSRASFSIIIDRTPSEGPRSS